MNRALQIGHLLLLLAGIAFLAILGWRAWSVSNELDATLAKINGPRGTIAMANEDVGALKSLIVHADLVARHEQQQLGTIDGYARNLDADLSGLAAHSNRTLDSLDRVSVALTGAANAASQTLHGASLTLSTMNDSIAATQPLIRDSDGLVKQYSLAAPAVVDTARNVQSMTADGARITKDAADEADKLAHPAKKKLGFWGGFWVGLTYVHKMLPPIF